MRYIKITSKRLQDYIEARGIEPIDEYRNISWYERTGAIINLLKEYQIRKTFYEKRN